MRPQRVRDGQPFAERLLRRCKVTLNCHKEACMSSTLNPDEGEPHIVKDTAHTTGALGPSDSSDSGSDVAGAKRHDFDRDTELDNHALETGDQELASDTDRAGTGERASADGDSTLSENSDINVDRVDDPFERDRDDLPDDDPDADESAR
jgi:hypothetical protein